MTSLSQGFVDYLTPKAPQNYHKAEVRKYRQRIHDILSTEHRLIAFFQSGSFQHGTAVMPYSDVDYVARIHFEDRPGSSNTILNNLRDLLRRELWEASSISLARPTVTVKFSGILTQYELTPAYLERGAGDDTRVLLIPGSGGGWRESAPQAHNKFVADMDSKHMGNVRMLARLLKAWKYEHCVSISSFYLELRAAEYGKNTARIFPLIAAKSVVASMVGENLPAMNDPVRLVSRIAPCSSEATRLAAMPDLRAFKKNLDASVSAWLANDRWEIV